MTDSHEVDLPAEKPAMPELLRPFIDKARERHKRRPPGPGVQVEASERGGWTFAAPHRELEPWEVQICDAFGTRSESTYMTFLAQLAELCSQDSDGPLGWRPNEAELNTALNIINGARPRNEIEAALAVQMVAVHFMMMKLSARALRNIYGDSRTMAVAGKLARTYAMQVETMAKLKGRTGRQKITVKYERHDHRHEHKHLHTDTQGGGSDFGGQAPPSADLGRGRKRPGDAVIEHEQCPALPGPDPARDALPGCGDARTEPMQTPRRGQGLRRPQGRTQRGVQDGRMDE